MYKNIIYKILLNKYSKIGFICRTTFLVDFITIYSLLHFYTRN